jgi:hypothetical protein
MELFLRNFECGAPWTAVALYLPPKAELLFWASGWAYVQRILRSCWAGEGPWAYQEGQMGQKMVCFGRLGAARSRQDEPIERRPEEQGTQDTHKKQLRGCGYSLQWPVKPPPF